MHKILFTLGSMPVHSYYVLWTAALMVGVWWTRRRMSRVYGCSDELAGAIVFWALMGVYVGARMGSVFDNWSYFSQHPLKIISPFRGGAFGDSCFFWSGAFRDSSLPEGKDSLVGLCGSCQYSRYNGGDDRSDGVLSQWLLLRH